MSHPSRIVAVSFAITFLSLHTAQSDTRLLADHPDLIEAFFAFHATVVSNLATGTSLANSVLSAANYGLDLDAQSYTLLNREALLVRLEIGKVDAEEQLYVHRIMAKNQNCDGPTLRGFENRRRQIVEDGWSDLLRQLAPGARRRLLDYVNGTFRNHVAIRGGFSVKK